MRTTLAPLLFIAFALAVQMAAPAHAQSPDATMRRLPRTASIPRSLLDESLIGPDESNVEFPDLPPDPYADRHRPLPPLEEELWAHGGSYLYHPEGDRLGFPEESCGEHYDMLRLPEDWRKPRPVEGFAEFLGADPIQESCLKWPGPCGYWWEPRFVGYGSYQLFAFALEENQRRQDVIGHQLLLDLDLRVTGTERLHVQFRPVGERNTGGSYYQFSNPSGFHGNGTIEPDRWWVEGEIHSIFGSWLDPFVPTDMHVVAGKFPFALHNRLLMNDDIIGLAVNKNTLFAGGLSNLNVQTFFAFHDVDSFSRNDSTLLGMHASVDYRHVFWEATYAYLHNDQISSRTSHYAALSRTSLIGPLSLAARALFAFGDPAGAGSGQLFVLESNYERVFDHNGFGVEHAIVYANAFWAAEGWRPISGGNFNRLRATFETNPLIRISAFRPLADTWGAAFGVQMFRHHDDESIIPEIAVESPNGEIAWGLGLRWQRKTGCRSFFEAQGVWTWSDDPRLEREGVFLSETILF